MLTRLNFFSTTSLFVIISLASNSLALFSQTISGIPLEAFEGFKQDSFTLPGDSIAQAVYKYGVYESTVTTTLEGVGKVYVHHVLYFQEEEYSYMEVYSRKPSSEFIEGIKRYGNFRMYEHRYFDRGTDYTGKPRVEFVHGLDSIFSTIYPLSIFRISEGKEMEISGQMNDNNSIGLNVDNCINYVDPTLYNSLNHDQTRDSCYFYGWIQYDLEMDLIKIDLILFTGEEYDILGTFESIIFDSEGNLIGHINDFGPLTLLTLTANHQFVYANTGGMLTEDYLAPYVFRIFDLHTGKVIFSKRSTTTALSGYAIANTNKGVFHVIEEPGTAYPERETYIIDHDKGIVYPLHLNSLCQPPTFTTFYPTYCECHKKDETVSKLNYGSELASMSLTEFLNRN